MRNIDFLTSLPGLKEPPIIFTANPVQNRRSIQKTATLYPQVICFGRGPVLRNPQALADFAQKIKAPAIQTRRNP